MFFGSKTILNTLQPSTPPPVVVVANNPDDELFDQGRQFVRSGVHVSFPGDDKKHYITRARGNSDWGRFCSRCEKGQITIDGNISLFNDLLGCSKHLLDQKESLTEIIFLYDYAIRNQFNVTADKIREYIKVRSVNNAKNDTKTNAFLKICLPVL